MISVEGVTKRYGPIVAVDRATFEVNRGEVVGFLGPNGAGKTTTMRMLTARSSPTRAGFASTARRSGRTSPRPSRVWATCPKPTRSTTTCWSASSWSTWPGLRGLNEAQARGGIGRVVEETGLADVFFRPIAEISKGYRQRTGMAGAILHEPEILVLDEPTEGLDPNQRVEIRKLVNALGAERTVILSTHVMQEVEATCDRLLVISRGASPPTARSPN